MDNGDGDGDGVTPRQGHVHVTCKSTSEPAGLGLGGDLLVAAEDGGPTHGRRATDHTDLSRTEICELEGRKKQRGGQGETELLEVGTTRHARRYEDNYDQDSGVSSRSRDDDGSLI